MRDYATPTAFRAAVEARLREQAGRLSAPAYMVRRQAALDRLLVRLTKVAPDRWALKGGLALQTRLGARARVSIDLDADHLHGAAAARADLQRAAIEDVGDHFGFAVGRRDCDVHHFLRTTRIGSDLTRLAAMVSSDLNTF